jgi:hypothetical protein
MDNAADAGFQFFADEIQQVGKIRIVGSFFHAHAADVRVAKVGKKRLDVLVIGQCPIITQAG